MSTEPSHLGGRLRILVVSESTELGRLVRSSLSHEPWLEWQLAECDSSEAARAHLEQHGFDLVVVQGGVEDVRGLVEWSTEAALIAVPSAGQMLDREALTSAGAMDCLCLNEFDGRPDLLWNALRQTIRYHAVKLQHRHLKNVLHERARQIARLSNRLVRSSPYDSRTGWLNHAHTVDRCQEEIGRAARYGLPLTLLLIDLLGLDQLELAHGDDFVDEVITQLGGRIRLISRHTDIAGHYGAESILLILTNTDAQGGEHFLDRVRRALGAAVVVDGTQAHVCWRAAMVTRTSRCDTSPTDLLNRLEQRIEEAVPSRVDGAMAEDSG